MLSQYSRSLIWVLKHLGRCDLLVLTIALNFISLSSPQRILSAAGYGAITGSVGDRRMHRFR